MSKERENIFSWRNELRGLSPIERARWFYDQKLVPSLANDVLEAEEARQARNHQEVKQIFTSWTLEERDQKILTKLERRAKEKEVDLTQQQELLKVGFAGLGRIEHVDANSQLKKISGELRRTPIINRIIRALQLHHRLGVETLVPWTIHNGSIHWLSEIAQDSANTQKIIGNESQAERILMEAIRKTAKIVSDIKEVDLTTPEENLKISDYSSWKKRRIYLGSLSALGVLWYRKARIEKHLGSLLIGLKCANRASRHEPNTHRVATLAIWTASCAIGKEYTAKRSTRIRALTSGVISFTKVFLRRPSEAIKAYKQYLEEN